MKHFSTLLAFFMVISILNAQNTVKRTPVYEVFSSSTCPPCKPANDHLVPIFKERKDQIAVVKYQMSWPGTGDPYYTPEGNGRRGITVLTLYHTLFEMVRQSPIPHSVLTISMMIWQKMQL